MLVKILLTRQDLLSMIKKNNKVHALSFILKKSNSVQNSKNVKKFKNQKILKCQKNRKIPKIEIIIIPTAL